MSAVEIQFQATSKDLHFISDPELAQIILKILTEIDNLAIIRAHRSIIYLSMSTLEGILSNVLSLNLKKIQTFTSYPKKKGGTSWKFEALKLAHKITIAKELDIIATEFFDTFMKFKEFRNYMHPLEELRSKQILDMGLGQIALGLMNHTVSKLERIRFIDEQIWKVISGVPLYVPSQNKIEFRMSTTPTQSFMVTEDYKTKDIEINFDLHIGEEIVFNFVFNYLNEEDFQMLRFDTRKNEFSGILHCKHKYGWQLIDEYKSKWVINVRELNKIALILKNGKLKAFLNGVELLPGKNIDYDNQKSFGFFNEVNNTFVSNLTIK